MRKKLYLVLLFVFFIQDSFSQCAMCKAVAEEQAEEVGSTVNTGILYIMAMPYLLLLIPVIFVAAYRKKIVEFLKDLKSAGVAK